MKANETRLYILIYLCFFIFVSTYCYLETTFLSLNDSNGEIFCFFCLFLFVCLFFFKTIVLNTFIFNYLSTLFYAAFWKLHCLLMCCKQYLVLCKNKISILFRKLQTFGLLLNDSILVLLLLTDHFQRGKGGIFILI